MSIFKRLSTTLYSRIDQVVGEIEDHDAVIEATMKEMHKKITEARVRLGQIKREQQQLQRQLENQQVNMNRWRERAIDVAQRDEDKALECLSRAHLCEQQITQLEQSLSQYEDTASKLAHDISTAENRLRDIKQKRSLMRARQSTSAAVQATHHDDTDTREMLDKTFERWEVKLGQAEMSLDYEPMTDQLEKEFLQQENKDELRNELTALLKNKGEDQ